MSKKLGRNDKCPCGSNKKYKHCCLKKGIKYGNRRKTKDKQSNLERTFFKQFHNIDLVSTLVALSLNPANHGKDIRLEYLILEALSTKSNSQKPVDLNELKEFLNERFSSHYLEDPPQNLFTENVPYTLGNNIVFGGNFEQGAFTLTKIINAVQFNQEKYPKDFLRSIKDAFLLLLTMSNSIASSLGYSRNLFGDHEDSPNELLFPDNINECKDAIFFTKKWINDFCQSLKIDKNILRHFFLDEGDRSNSKNELGDFQNPLIRKPLALLDIGTVVVSPTTIVSALIHFTWVQAELFGCKDELIDAFHRDVAQEAAFFFNKLSFKEETFDFEVDENLPSKNALFRFDTDKLVFLSLMYDEGDEYSKITPCHDDPMLKMDDIKHLQDRNFKAIKKKYNDEKIIDLTLYSTIGRSYAFAMPNRENTHSLITSVYRFLCWIKSESHDEMALWYYLEAVSALYESMDFVSATGFLDFYSFYEEKKSFYFGDSQKPNYVTFLPGGSLKIIKKAVDSEDRIMVYYKVPEIAHPVFIPVIKFDGHIPRYISVDIIGKNLEYYIPDYSIDIWVVAKYDRQNLSKEGFQIYWEFLESVCFWFGQIKDLLDVHLLPINGDVFLLELELLNLDMFTEISSFGKKDTTAIDKFKFYTIDDKIELKVPGEINGHISLGDNEGERIILSKILEGIGQLLNHYDLENTLTNQVIWDIIDHRIPLGLKKMMFVVNSKFELRLDNRNIVPARYIQEARKQWVMDAIVPMLGSKCPEIGEITEKEDKEKLGKSIVFSLLKKLRNLLRSYNSVELLLELMANFESLVHDTALMRLRTPTRQQCFAEQEDIVKELQEKIRLSDETTLTYRCLIEHLAAEPTFGNDVINQQVIDDAMAIMSLLIWWGGVGDKVKFDLFDVQLSVLPSGRIGTNSGEIAAQFFQQFSNMRTKEYIDSTVDGFDSFYTEVNAEKSIASDAFLKVFETDIGISFAKLGGIVTLLCQIGLEQNTPVARFYMPELIQTIQESFEENFSKEEIFAAIDFLKLWNRKDVIKVPNGFKDIDISPWRYNRKLSYIQRPFILVDYGEYKNNPIIFWTPRHLDHSWLFINNLFISGRYRAEEKSELEKQISKISKNRGLVLQNEVVAWVKEKTNWLLEEEVKISHNAQFKASRDTGDIDVLAINHDEKIIFSIECKRTESARNSKEMVGQVDDYFGRNSKKGYFEKHQNRHEWLTKNIERVGTVYKFDSADYRVISLFVTYEILAIQYMKNRLLPMPTLSLYELKNMDVDEFLSKTTP